MLHTALIGYPQVGKTTLFHLMTSGHEGRHTGHVKVEAAIGVARVPDSRLDRLFEMFHPKRRVPATVEFADLPGGARPSAQALLDVAPYRDSDALVHVVRAFRDGSIPHAPGPIRPAADAQAMEDELILTDLGVAERRLDRIDRDLKKMRSADLEAERDTLARCRAALEQGAPLRAIELPADARKRLRGFAFLSARPLLVVMNLDEADSSLVGDAAKAADAVGLSAFLGRAATRAVALCAKVELEIAQLPAPDRAAFLADLGFVDSGADRVIRAVYDLLGCITFLTLNEQECRAWPIPRGTHAQAAAGEVHTDMARGFIRAEVTRFEHLAARGSFAACREHGELRLEGKDYVVHDGDVITFRFAT